MLQVNTDLECQLEAERRKIQQFQDTVVKTQTKMADHRVATQRVVIDNPQEVEKRKLLDDIEQLKPQSENNPGLYHCGLVKPYDGIDPAPSHCLNQC